MSLPLVFRHIARLELDESILWYENKRPGLGNEFRLVLNDTFSDSQSVLNSSGKFADQSVELSSSVSPIRSISYPRLIE